VETRLVSCRSLYLLHSEIGREAMIRMTGFPPLASLFIAIAGLVVLSLLVVKFEPLPRAALKSAGSML
jgi:hypothetical protein